jgi:hypothetical protein
VNGQKLKSCEIFSSLETDAQVGWCGYYETLRWEIRTIAMDRDSNGEGYVD